jgi:hypothetical protein
VLQPADLQAQLLDAGHAAFDVRAVVRLVLDYTKVSATSK